jgi:hypothetical protein
MPTPRSSSGWYCDEAIGLLDRLCDIGPKRLQRPLRNEEGIRAEERLGGTWLDGLRRLVPALGRAGQPS